MTSQFVRMLHARRTMPVCVKVGRAVGDAGSANVPGTRSRDSKMELYDTKAPPGNCVGADSGLGPCAKAGDVNKAIPKTSTNPAGKRTAHRNKCANFKIIKGNSKGSFSSRRNSDGRNLNDLRKQKRDNGD